MRRLAIAISLLTLVTIVWQVFAFRQPYDLRPLFFSLPCAFALLAFVTPRRAWVTWCAWFVNFFVGATVLLLCIFSWQFILYSQYAGPVSSLFVQIGVPLVVAPLVNVIALRPWATSGRVTARSSVHPDAVR